MIGGFGTAGIPNELIDGLIEQGARDLTVVNNNAGNADQGLAALLKTGRVRKIICSFPRQADSHVFDELYRSGKIELELVPQGNLAERMRAAGAGIGAFFTPDRLTAPSWPRARKRAQINGTALRAGVPDPRRRRPDQGRERRPMGQPHLPQGGAQLRAGHGHGGAGAPCATVHEIVPLGALDPEHIVTPGIFVSKIVKIERVATQAGGFRQAA